MPASEPEDTMTIESHVEWLKNEYKKNCQNVQAVKLRMEMSFNYRRALIVNGNRDTREIINMFPFLKTENIVSFLINCL